MKKAVICLSIMALVVFAQVVAAQDTPTSEPANPDPHHAAAEGGGAEVAPEPTVPPPVSESSGDDPMASHSMDMMDVSMGANTASAMDSDDAGGHNIGPVSSEGVPDATETTGAQPLNYTLDGDVKVFELTTRAVR